MCLFYLIKQYNRIRPSSDCLGKLTAFIVSDISRRRSDQTGHGIFLHVLTHIDTHHIVLIIKQILGKCFCKLCLTYTCRSKKEEGTNRLSRIFDSCFGTDDCIGYFRNAFVLSDDTFECAVFHPFPYGIVFHRIA